MNKIGEDGLTEDTAWTISNLEELKNFRDRVNGTGIVADNFKNKFVKLSNNIDMSSEQSWTPIGNTVTNYFGGNFNGAYYGISNFTISNPNADYQGFFGIVSGGNIRNIEIIKISIKGKGRVGGLIGLVENPTVIVGCSILQGTVNTYSGSVGGLIGEIAQNGTVIENCNVSLDVIAENGNAGGLVGSSLGVSILRCVKSGLVQVTSSVLIERGRAGGLIGSMGANVLGHTIITDCFIYGSVRSKVIVNHGCFVGGIIGFAGFNNGGTITISNVIVVSDIIEADGFHGNGYTSAAGALTAGYGIKVYLNNSIFIVKSYYTNAQNGGARYSYLIVPTGSPSIYTDWEITGSGNLYAAPVSATGNGSRYNSYSVNTSAQSKTINQLQAKSDMMPEQVEAVRKTYTDIGWDFNNTWVFNPAENDGFPCLAASGIPIKHPNSGIGYDISEPLRSVIEVGGDFLFEITLREGYSDPIVSLDRRKGKVNYYAIRDSRTYIIRVTNVTEEIYASDFIINVSKII